MLRKIVKSVVAVGLLAGLSIPMVASAHEHEGWDDGDDYGWRAHREHEWRKAFARRERWERWAYRHHRPEVYRYEVQVPVPVYYGPYGTR